MGPKGADGEAMNCTRCGAHATIKRDDGYVCGSCSIAADWREIIRLVQDARVDSPVAGQGDPTRRTA